MHNFREEVFFRDGVRSPRPANEGTAGAGTRRATVKPLFSRFKRFKLRGYVIYLLTGRNALKTKIARKICLCRKYVVSLQPNSKTAKQ